MGCCARAGLPLRWWRLSIGLLSTCAAQAIHAWPPWGSFALALPFFTPSCAPPLQCPARFSTRSCPFPPPPPVVFFLKSVPCPQSHQVSRGFEPRSLDSESRVLTVTPRDHLDDLEDMEALSTRLASVVVVDGAHGGGQRVVPMRCCKVKSR